ncbi:MAG: C69 family dipeptidase [Prevotellaceae bacterium]|nr:C69 family dipeptidase [Prevotellaceae bacterium]
MKQKLILLSTFIVLGISEAFGCTNLIVGKKASTDGSVIVSYSADSYGMFGELYHYKAATYPQGAMRDVYEWDTGKYLGQIPEARQTYNVIGNINEFQLTIGETTFGGRHELVDTTGIIDYGSLIYITLQRARTAREAIRVMTDLVQQYGYYSSGESFSIADPNEAWVLEMIGKGPGVCGAVWVAVRIPDDCISAHANQSRIHQFDMNDKENCLYSSDVISFAREKGYFDGLNKDFSFAKAYNPLDFGGRRACEARVWSFFNRYTTRGEEFLPYILGQTDEPMPLYLKPSKQLSVADIQNMMRDHYEGTPLDITNDIGAGPWASPYRPSPLSFNVDGVAYFNERPISTQQPAFVFVSQMRANLANAIGGVFWFTLDDANTSAFTPIYCCTDRVPDSFAPNGADGNTFSWDNAWWLFNWVSNMVYPRYTALIDDIRRAQDETEGNYLKMQPAVEETAAYLMESDPELAKEYLVNYSLQMAAHTTHYWKKLGEYLIVKHNDQVVHREENGKFMYNRYGRQAAPIRPGFPKAFLEKYVEATGDRYKTPQE